MDYVIPSNRARATGIKEIEHFYANVLIVLVVLPPRLVSLYCDYLTWTNSRDTIKIICKLCTPAHRKLPKAIRIVLILIILKEIVVVARRHHQTN